VYKQTIKLEEIFHKRFNFVKRFSLLGTLGFIPLMHFIMNKAVDLGA